MFRMKVNNIFGFKGENILAAIETHSTNLKSKIAYPIISLPFLKMVTIFTSLCISQRNPLI